MGVVRVKASAWLVSCLLFLSFWKNARGLSTPLPLAVCQKYNLEDTVLIQVDQCPRDGNRDNEYGDATFPRASEMNGTSLERVLNILQSRSNTYVAVLFYAEWCPFSKLFRPMFDTLSSAVPAIYHLAVEESAVRPSVLSQYGVHSFPVLLLLNKTHRFRYHGPRTGEALVQFYKDSSGLQSISLSNTGTDTAALLQKPEMKGVLHSKENHSYRWPKIPETGFYDDKYLALATIFVSLRILFYLLPKILISIKQYWSKKETSLQAHIGVLRRFLLLEEEKQCSNSSSQSIKGKNSRKETRQENKEKGKRGLSVPGWSSSSLAAVALAEGSSSKVGFIEDTREIGHTYKSHIWG